ncbi:hypothetical protein M0813_06323 [Anaeramoeba flamelloides]|uniref:MULE transposase domain-containing protein n=1 Tax=Anaeramoeba flamelloides TaxID=1746091 RepID=A0ABQ8XFT8_9EUKA|nr:hypothetical protein M0813_06323 [Anaeramoeba flamelloides]
MNNYYFEKYQELSNDHLELLNHVEEIKNRNKELESKNSQNLSKNTEMKKLEEQFNLMAIKNNEVKLCQDQEDSLNIPNNWRNIDSGNKILFEKKEKIDLKKIKRVFYYENEQDTEVCCLHYNNKYFSKSKNILSLYYECNVKKCNVRGTIKTFYKNGEQKNIIEIQNRHSHNTNLNFELQTIPEMDLLDNLAKENNSLENIYLKFMDSQIRKIRKSSAILLGSRDDIKKYILEFRKQLNFDVEKKIMEDKFSKTEMGFPFIRMYLQGDFPMIIMATNNQLLNLGNNQQIYVDGTYLACSQGYHCLMTIMTYDFQTQIYIPCVWGILSDEKASTQLFFYNYIKKLLKMEINKNFMWNPPIITTDFSLANINSIKTSFPKSSIHGCHFHFLQAIRRKLLTLGLNENFRNKIQSRITKYMNKSTDYIRSDVNKWINNLKQKITKIKIPKKKKKVILKK